MQQQVAAEPVVVSTAMEVVLIADKNANFSEWDQCITDSRNFMAGSKSAFNSSLREADMEAVIHTYTYTWKADQA